MILFTIASQSIIKIHININDKNSKDQDLIDQFPISSLNANKTPFIVGFDDNPATLDPVDTWELSSMNVQHQVVEGLVDYNLSSQSSFEIIPKLAEYWYWHSPTKISFKIRENVYFHDGTLLNANVVKWNFERLMWFSNVTGALPLNGSSWEAFPISLYFLSDGTFIFSNFEVSSAYNFTIYLNAPFAALLDLLCFGATSILSPNSTPKYGYLDLSTDKLVGTGPFVYDDFIRDVEIRFHAYHNYWGGKAEIEEMIWMIVEDDIARMNAALAGTYEYVTGVLKSYIDIFRADPDFHVEDVGEDLWYFYLEIYSGPDKNPDGSLKTPGDYQGQKNNATLRRALAWALNYTYIWDGIQSRYAVEGTPAVPRAMPGHNSSVVQASDSKYNWTWGIYQARQLMASMYPTETAGLDLHLGTDDALWDALSLRTLEVNRHLGSTTNLRLNLLMEINFGLIGIDLVETIRDWGDYLDTGENSPWEMDIAYINWYSDYLNPFNMVDPLFNLASGACFSRINDTSPGGLTELMDTAAVETNRTLQLEIYQNIQSYLYDVERPLTPASHAHISTWVYLVQSVHDSDLLGVNYNVISILDFYSIKWNKTIPPPGSFLLISNAGTPDDDGTFILGWTSSAWANSYSIYMHNSSISIIDGSQTLLLDHIATSLFPVSGLASGDYYFVVVAHNTQGDTLSNNIYVNVSLMPPGSFVLTSDAGTPDSDGNFDLSWTSSTGADNYSIYRHDSYISIIDGGQTLLVDQVGIFISPLSVSGLASGVYYFVVVAHNRQGDTLSNNLNVNVSVILPESFVLTSDAEFPDNDGTFNLFWTISTGADNYSIYRHDSSISIIDGSQTLLVYQIAIFLYPVSGLASGEYYFIVVAHNGSVDTLSNNLFVIVQLSEAIPGYNVGLLIAITSLTSIYFIKKRRK